MASRAIIGKVNRQGNGQAIYLAHGRGPAHLGAMLLKRYSTEERIARLIRMGAIAHLEPVPERSVAYFRDRRKLWEHCRPYTFSGGTKWFFANYWSPAPQWLYVWTPDGWLASEAMPGTPPECYGADSDALRDADPQWWEWLRRTREFQRPQPLHSLIRDYLERQRGSDDRDAGSSALPA